MQLHNGFTLPPDPTLVCIQDLCMYMPYLKALLSESVKLMFSQYESGMTLQEWFKYIRSNRIIVLFLLVI